MSNEKVIIIHGLDNDDTVCAMRAVKAALGPAHDIAFATSTPNNLRWELSALISHVYEEHTEMKAGRHKDKDA